jgi:hypothetical protein
MAVPVTAAFEGFRIIRRRPVLMLFWGALILIGNALAFGAIIYWGGDALMSLFSAGPALEDDPQLMLSIMADLAGPYVLMLLIMIFGQAILNCAVFRAVDEAPQTSFGYLRLGRDEWRLILLSILFFLLSMGVNIASSLVGMFIGLPLGLLMGEDSGKLMAKLISLALYFYVLIRLSLCFVQSYDEQKINLFGSWGLTKGNVLNLIGVYIVAGVMAILVGALCIVIFALIAALAMGGNFEALLSLSETSTPEEVMNALLALRPVLILYLLFGSVVIAPLLTAISSGTPAAIYKALKTSDNAA